MIIRVSIGFFDASRSEEISSLLTEWEATLSPAVGQLNGNLAYYVTVDSQIGAMTNISHWKTLDDAVQMAALPEMLAMRERFTALGVEFIKITNHEILWKM